MIQREKFLLIFFIVESSDNHNTEFDEIFSGFENLFKPQQILRITNQYYAEIGKSKLKTLLIVTSFYQNTLSS